MADFVDFPQFSYKDFVEGKLLKPFIYVILHKRKNSSLFWDNIQN